ncbi:MAG: dihydrofolate reductase family protein [Thaumarchaeota archaeon]|nr:dihydrofolate reductase family protein [Nitrososphaerota archaeon]
MKIVQYMGLMANGCYAVVDESNQSGSINLEEVLPKEVMANFAQTVGKFGDLIIGRRTFDLFPSRMPGIEMVVLSRSPLKYEGVNVAASPSEALSLLEKKGFETALVGGGAQIVSTFLSQGLVDELYINIYPLIGKGSTFATSENFQASLELIGVDKLSSDIVQLHYRVRR